jgi:hypothetical protein
MRRFGIRSNDEHKITALLSNLLTFNQPSRLNLTLPDAQGVPPKQYDHKIEVVVDSSHRR